MSLSTRLFLLLLTAVHNMWGNLVAYLSIRVVQIVLAIVFDFVFPDHIPTGAKIYYCDSQQITPLLHDVWVCVLGGKVPYDECNLVRAFTRWDSAHFLDIMKHGYQDEQLFAFFPLYPETISTIARALVPEHPTNALVVISVIFNIALGAAGVFCLSLYAKQSLSFSKSEIRSLWFVFALNPSTIFFIAPYSESLYFFLMCAALLASSHEYQGIVWLCLCCASLTRSNGLLNIILWMGILVQQGCVRPWREWLWRAWRIPALLAATWLPFQVLNFRWLLRICSVSVTATPALCYKHGTHWWNYIPNAYAYIQHKYWNVGYLHAYEWRQIPNAMLVLPTLAVTQYALSSTIASDKYQNPIDFMLYSPWFPHVLHLVCVCSVCLCYAHFQTISRVLWSGCPVLLLVTAKALCGSTSPCSNKPWRWRFVAYLCLYQLLGLVLHTNFYPIT